MKKEAMIQLVRNATLIINYAGKKILIDPMFSPKGLFDPFAGIARNPTVELPLSVDEIGKDVDLVLVSHTHPDHFDPAASERLDKSVKLLYQPADKDFFDKTTFTNAEVINDSFTLDDITIYRTDGKHGSGEPLKMMGTVSGFVLQASGNPTIYIVGDSIWIPEVEQTIQKFNPDYIVVNSGGAIIPGFEQNPILMDEDQVIKLIDSTDAKVIAVHMDALDHCRTTRASLKQELENAGINDTRWIIPQDGERVDLSV